jgi:hypothetical protein
MLQRRMVKLWSKHQSEVLAFTGEVVMHFNKCAGVSLART